MKHPLTIEQLDKDFKSCVEFSECSPKNKLQYLGQYIFDFTTYDSEMDEYFAKKMIEVLKAIEERTTFEYIKKDYINYLTMANMPFLYDNLDWGGSIRGAWFDYAKPDFAQSVKIILQWADII